jgi:hypothetical protein
MVYFRNKNPDFGMENVGILMTILRILWQFGIFFPFWNAWTKNNLATLLGTQILTRFYSILMQLCGDFQHLGTKIITRFYSKLLTYLDGRYNN